MIFRGRGKAFAIAGRYSDTVISTSIHGSDQDRAIFYMEGSLEYTSHKPTNEAIDYRFDLVLEYLQKREKKKKIKRFIMGDCPMPKSAIVPKKVFNTSSIILQKRNL